MGKMKGSLLCFGSDSVNSGKSPTFMSHFLNEITIIFLDCYIIAATNVSQHKWTIYKFVYLLFVKIDFQKHHHER